MIQTDKFAATLGITPGYFHNSDNKPDLKIVGAMWQLYAAQEFAKTGCYVGAVIQPSRTAYHTDWGCPEGGEHTISITGERNPTYDQDSVRWQETVIAIMARMANEMEQKTAQITFSTVDFVYLHFPKKTE